MQTTLVQLVLEPDTSEQTPGPRCAEALRRWHDIFLIDRPSIDAQGVAVRFFVEPSSGARRLPSSNSPGDWKRALEALESQDLSSILVEVDAQAATVFGRVGGPAPSFVASSVSTFMLETRHLAESDDGYVLTAAFELHDASPIGLWKTWLEWAKEAAVALQVGGGWIDRSDRMGTGYVRIQSNGFPGVAWGMFVGGTMLATLGGRAGVLADYPGLRAEDLTVDGSELVYLQLSDDPSDVSRESYERAFSFLGPVLEDGAQLRIRDDVLEELIGHIVDGVDDESLSSEARAVSAALPGPTPEESEHLRDDVEPEPVSDDSTTVSSAHPDPPDSPSGLRATFKSEDQAGDGEDVGPLIVYHPGFGVIWESEDWMRESDARRLSEEKGWRYWADR